MQIGIGLPATIPGARPDIILDWAKLAEAGPFSSLGIIDRIAYPNFEPLMTLAAAAALTQRVRLMTTVLLAPTRNAGVLAKQAASLDVLSGGRLTLGLGIGGREDDFRAAPASFSDRGRRFEEQLALMKRIWSGQPVAEDIGPVGPPPVQPGGPEILIGGYTPTSIRRVGRWGDGFITGGIPDPNQARQLYSIAEEAWRAESRPGRPRFVGGIYYGLGPRAEDSGRQYLRHYYAFLGPGAEQIANAMLSTAEAIKTAIQGFSDVGMDELIFWPCVAELDQVERLAEIVH